MRSVHYKTDYLMHFGETVPAHCRVKPYSKHCVKNVPIIKQEVHIVTRFEGLREIILAWERRESHYFRINILVLC
jgi:hypothetical protein